MVIALKGRFRVMKEDRRTKKSQRRTLRFLSCALLLIIAISCGYYLIKIYNINNSYHNLYDWEGEIGLRKFPYPYKAALSICSDIDGTSTVEEFLEIQEFLNTKT